MENPKKEVTLEVLFERMENGFAEIGETVSDLASKVDTRMEGVESHVALLENQVFDLRVDVQGVKRIVTPYDTDITNLKERVRTLEEAKR